MSKRWEKSYWSDLREKVRESSPAVADLLIECRPTLINRKMISLVSGHSEECQASMRREIREASRAIVGARAIVSFTHPSDAPKPGEPASIVLDPEPRDDDYPKWTSIMAHYPNRNLILTGLGVAGCKDSSKFKLGLRVLVHKGKNNKLVIHSNPKYPNRFL